MKVCVIVGTRPEAIKLAPVILELKQRSQLQCCVCVTGQHREMLDQVTEFFRIVPDADLNLMQPGQTLGSFTARAMGKLDEYLAQERPDLVLAQGDTTTTFCAALAAFYQRIPLGHVEAGLRTWNMSSPWPEEGNRVLTSRLATLHFAPTETARINLLKEGVSEKAIFVTGNTVVDALLIAHNTVRGHPPVIAGLPTELQPASRQREGAPTIVLITGHRREHFGGPFENICRAIAELAQRFPEVHFVYPVHLNPNVREPVIRLLGGGPGKIDAKDICLGRSKTDLISCRANVHLLDPLAYAPFVALMDRSTLILTDSGGVQEEAPSLGKPVLVMRNTTERPEAVDAGTVRIVGTVQRDIVEGVTQLLTDEAAYRAMSERHNPYGDGKSAPRIVEACVRFLTETRRSGNQPLKPTERVYNEPQRAVPTPSGQAR